MFIIILVIVAIFYGLSKVYDPDTPPKEDTISLTEWNDWQRPVGEIYERPGEVCVNFISDMVMLRKTIGTTCYIKNPGAFLVLYPYPLEERAAEHLTEMQRKIEQYVHSKP
jgi:hypothetical protein